MWTGPAQDPGGDPDSGPPNDPSSSRELHDLKDQFEQQQVLIAQLKEMIRKSEQSNVTQEKVDEYMNTLSKRARKGKVKREGPETSRNLDTPVTGKINLLRQQLEENKAKLAERGKSQKGIEEMVTQLKAQLDDSQQLINQTPLNLSLQEVIKIEYNSNSTSEELYSALVTKEKRITELITKVQKLESHNLDLQENLKEKDSVINAKTKAITLMTESLSKKNKTTLDTLDDTKEQMRKMQENFANLEAEMKARQMKLLDDLRLKNYEIAELQDINSGLEHDNTELKQKLDQITSEKPHSEVNFDEIISLKERITQLEELNSKLQDTGAKLKKSDSNESLEPDVNIQAELEELRQNLEKSKADNDHLLQVISQHETTIAELRENAAHLDAQQSNPTSDVDEVVKLKRQLDDSNKNMIKIKAQHKSKVKELTKKIETFKKASDANAEIVKLEAENCKLNQKVVELEEEKGALQLKLVNVDNGKATETPSFNTEELETALEEKNKVIELLEADISSKKSEIEALNDQINSFSHWENTQVTSEITSIHFEEQLDQLENEKRQLMAEKDDIVKDNQELVEKLDQLKKDKQELAAKLESYVQENMELIDKLEKLSAEKVSSAESIEIVEGLTQQEKLELEAYQKGMDLALGNLKASEENLTQTVDLNESVNELTEETSELLQKIELFTVERREVMEKMEQLKQENGELSLKIKEIENNRDVLAETYEQVQSEKDSLNVKMNALESEIMGLKMALDQRKSSSKGSDLQKQYNKIVQDNSSLTKKLEESERTRDDLVVKLTAADDEIVKLKIDIDSLKANIDEQVKENAHLSNNMAELNRTLSNRTNENTNLQAKLNQLEIDKQILIETIDKSRADLETANNQQEEIRRLLESKENEIRKLIKERDNTGSVISNLQQTLKDKDELIHKLSSEFKESYLSVQKKLDSNSAALEDMKKPMEAKIDELTSKNKEQLEKMKKIAANLKKKSQAYQDLEGQFRESREKWELELQEKSQSFAALSHDFEQFKTSKAAEFAQLQAHNVDLQNIVTDLRLKLDKTNELSLQRELMQTHDNLDDSQTNENTLQSKIEELEMIIETQEADIVKYRDRVSNLEEGMSILEENRLGSERRVTELNAQLEEQAQNYDENSKRTSLFEERMLALNAENDARRKEMEDNVAELTEINKQLSDARDKLQKKLDQALSNTADLKQLESVVEDLETMNVNKNQQIHHLENELRRLQKKNDKLEGDLDKLNSDWQSQFDEVTQHRNELLIKCEKLEETVRELSERQIYVTNELEGKIDLLQTENSKQVEEHENLSKIIEKKDAEIDDHKKQNLQLQLQVSNSAASFFDSFSQSDSDKKLNELESEKARLESELVSLREQLQNTQSTVSNIPSTYFAGLSQNDSDKVNELQIINKRLEDELILLREQLQSAYLQIQTHQLNLTTNPSSFFDSGSGPDHTTVDNVQDDRETLKHELSAVRQQLEAFQSDYDRRIQQLESDKAQLEVEVVRVRHDLQNAQSNLGKSTDQISLLKSDLLLKAAVQTVDSVISEAQNKVCQTQAVPATVDSSIAEAQKEVSQTSAVPTFTWCESSHDPFDFVQSSVTEQQLTRVTLEQNQSQNVSQQDLLNKIKTLEFMLYNVEREKDETLVQCHQLSNELATLLYERQTAQQAAPSLESQILQPADIADTPASLRELQRIEFERSQAPVMSTPELGPVAEESLKCKEAYLCYDPDNDPNGINKDKSGAGNVESQIVTAQVIVNTPETKKELQHIEFEPSRAPVMSTPQFGPVAEEPLKCKQAYLCYDPDTDPDSTNKDKAGASNVEPEIVAAQAVVDTPETKKELQLIEFERAKPPVVSVTSPIQEDTMQARDAYVCYDVGAGRDTFGDNDDGWGWGPDESKLDEEHVQLEAQPQLNHLKQKILALESDCDNYVENIKQLQAKNGKLLKKLKEFKLKNQELSQSAKKANVDFNLDDTIQEELKLQIQQVEKKLKECHAELDKEKAEKASILKRVEVLTGANERLIEMKEKQDVEVLGWQQSCRELQAKLQQFEWGDDGFASHDSNEDKSPKKTTGEDVDKLLKKVQDLNDMIKDLTLDNEELQALLEEQRSLRVSAEKSKPLERDNTKTEAEYLQVVTERDQLSSQMQLSREEKKQLQDEVNRLIQINNSSLIKYEEIEQQNQHLAELVRDKDAIIEQLNATVQRLEAEKITITNVSNTYSLEDVEQYKRQIDELSRDKQALFNELQAKNSQIDATKDNLQAEIISLKAQLDSQIKSAQNLADTIQQQEADLRKLASELAAKDDEIGQLADEWAQRVDQRGSEVAESWKLHVDSRTAEFCNVESNLKKEIYELEEKCNALVNENNELRRNVDAKISNEVDRVSALQQQISDRQQYINDLTAVLQDKQTEIDSLRQEVATLTADLQSKDAQLDGVQSQLQVNKSIVDAVVEHLRDSGYPETLPDKDAIIATYSAQLSQLHENQGQVVVLQGKIHQIQAELSAVCQERADEQLTSLRNLEDREQTIANLRSQLEQSQHLKEYENENIQNLQQNLTELQQLYNNCSVQLQEKNGQVEHHQRLLQDKDSEVGRLKLLLEEKDREQAYAIESISQESQNFASERLQEIDSLKRRLRDSENHYEELLSTKNAEMDHLQLQLNENADKATELADKIHQVEDLSAQLRLKGQECTNLQSKVAEQNSLMDEENKQLTDLRNIIEDQVLKIEQLKKDLFEKSNDYDSLIAEVDMSQQELAPKQDVPERVRPKVDDDDDLSEPVNRAELDLALYMLHQRDVRCEELTVELTQLLEERDILQLRLSNSIREMEFAKRSKEGEDTAAASVAAPSAEVAEAAAATSKEGGDSPESDRLANKLSELKTIGYKRDKTIVDEQELRRLQDYRIMQQHRDDASRLPPEAAARLVDASYTLSRDVQSPSKVLLNWLWGRSTPKVNNI